MTKTRAKTLEMKWFLLTLLRIQFDPYISMSKSELGKLTNQLLTQDEWIKLNNAILFREKSVGLYRQAMARAIAWDTAFRRKCSEARHCKRLTTWNIHCKRGTRVKREGSSTTSIAKLNFPGTHWRGLALIGAQKKPCWLFVFLFLVSLAIAAATGC